jgi:hypothetical protein
VSLSASDAQRTCATTTRELEPGAFYTFVALQFLFSLCVLITAARGLRKLRTQQKKLRFNLQTLALCLLGSHRYTACGCSGANQCRYLTSAGLDAATRLPAMVLFAMPVLPIRAASCISQIPDTFSNVAFFLVVLLMSSISGKVLRRQTVASKEAHTLKVVLGVVRREHAIRCRRLPACLLPC